MADDMHYYRAFELNIASEFHLEMLEETVQFDRADVSIVNEMKDYLDKIVSDHQDIYHAQEYDGKILWNIRCGSPYAFNVPEGISFVMEEGRKISVIFDGDRAEDGVLAVYILGSCMGTILHQRGVLPVHGSCVEKDGNALIIMGNSGAGKSTTAREFLRHGWKLITDDVTVIDFSAGRPQAVPSYPSQKLWEDAIDHYGIDDGALTPLWQEERKEKFHVAVRDSFCNERADLKYALWLIEGKEDCGLEMESIEGFSVADRFMRNIYRFYAREKDNRNIIFQQCVDLSKSIRLFECVRPAKKDCAREIYDKVTALIEDTEKDL